MPTPQPQYRSHTTPQTPKSRYYEPPGDSIEVREDIDGDDGVFEIRMPIATTGEVRNEGDDPLTRSELEGMAKQIGDGVVSVFPDHGQTTIGGPQRYSIGEKGGEWADAEVVGEQDASSNEAELVATARLMDPDTLPDIPIRDMLGTIKELTNRDMSVPSSIGWRDDENAPGGNDLMEASIVGIGADPRTTSDAETAVVARAAVDAGADPDALIAKVRSAIESDKERPLGPPEDPERFDSFEECKQALMEDEDLSEEEAERICGSWENQSAESDSVTDDSDTGSGEAGTTDGEQNTNDDGEEFREFMREQQETQTELLRTLADALRQEDDEDEDDEGDEDDEENEADDDDEDEDDDEEEQSADTQDADDGDLKERIADLEDALADVRSGEVDVETPGADEEQDAPDEGDSTTEARPTRETWGRTTN